MTDLTIIGLLAIATAVSIPIATRIRDRQERRNRYGFPRTRGRR